MVLGWSVVPNPALLCIAYAMLGPPVSEGAVVLEGAVDALHTQCLAPGFGGGCGFGSVDANTDEMSVFATWCRCLCCTASSAT